MTGNCGRVFAVDGARRIRGVLLHLGQNMWGEYLAPGEMRDPKMQYTFDRLQTDETTWRNLTALMRKRGYNFAVIDVGEGVVLPSHPELAVRGSWSADRMRDEVARLREMGIEAIPKFNFSTCHDGWLKQYGRMVSTPKYYEVVRDVINDACDIFGNPAYFHLGLDEEGAMMQKNYPLIVYRQGDLWWHDFFFYLDCLQKRNARPIVFTSWCGSENLETFDKRVPKEVINNVGWHQDVPELEWLKERAKVSEFRAHQLKVLDFFKKLGEWKRPVLVEASNWLDKSKIAKPWPIGKDYPRHPKAIVTANELIRSHVSEDCYLGSICTPWGHIKPELEDYWSSGINQLADYMDGKGF